MTDPLRLQSQGSPRGLKRLMFRAPIWIYRARLGFILRHRFVMLEHTGRKSGLKRQVVLEVVAEEDDAIYVAAAWGNNAQWYQNVSADPAVGVHLGSSRWNGVASPIDAAEAKRVLSSYGEAHPGTLAELARFMLVDPGQTTEEHVANVARWVPLVRIPKPVQAV